MTTRPNAAANVFAKWIASNIPYTGVRLYTVVWVKLSCEADGLPSHLVSLVIDQVQDELTTDTFPLLEGEMIPHIRKLHKQ